MGKNLTVMRADLRTDLDDTGALWSNGEIDRGVERAIADLSRFLPMEQSLEVQLQFEVSSESWTAAATAGTYVSLANKPVKKDSETVKDSTVQLCVRGTDYLMDYSNGKITHIAGGKIANAEVCTISYTKSRVAISLSSLGNLIRVDRVEYPGHEVPQKYVSWTIWNSILFIGSSDDGTQENLTEDRRVVVYYYCEHTIPTIAATGTVPGFLDNTVELAAGAYMLFNKAHQCEHQAIAGMATANTALGNLAAIHILVDAALDKVATHVAEADAALDKVATHVTEADAALDKVDTYLAGTTDSSKAILAKIASDTIRTEIEAAVDAAATALGLVSTDLSDANSVWADELKHIRTDATQLDAHEFLDLGRVLINAVNLGADAPALYRTYADAALGMARTWAQKRQDFITQAATRTGQAAVCSQEAAQRIEHLASYISQSLAYGRVGETFIAEAAQRLGMATTYNAEAEQRISLARAFVDEALSRVSEMDRYIAEAERYEAVASANLRIAESFKLQAIERRNEAWSIWRDSRQYIGSFSLTPVVQPIG